MDKKTKLLVGAGIVGVGAYLLWKSKKATTPAVTAPAAPAAANMVGFLPVGDQEKFTNAEGSDFASVGIQEKFNAEGGDFASVKSRMMNQNGNQYSKEFYDVKGGHAGIPDQGIFKKIVGEKQMNQTGKSAPKKKVSVTFGPSSGEFITDSTRKVAKLVGANGAPSFFSPRTAKYGSNQGVFARKPVPVMDEPRRKTPVEPMMPVAVTQAAPRNNMVGLINGAAVSSTNW